MGNPIADMLNSRGQNNSRNLGGLPTSLDDPRMTEAKAYVQNHGGNPQQAFYQLYNQMAKQALNPAAIINKILGK